MFFHSFFSLFFSVLFFSFWFSSRRYKTWQTAYETIMLKYMDLCVQLQQHRQAKDGLHQYRNMAQQQAPGSLEVAAFSFSVSGCFFFVASLSVSGFIFARMSFPPRFILFCRVPLPWLFFAQPCYIYQVLCSVSFSFLNSELTIRRHISELFSCLVVAWHIFVLAARGEKLLMF